MLRWAVRNEARAFVAPAPCVDLNHAWPRSVHTLFICGMFGIGTPPAPASPIWLKAGSLTFLIAAVFAGERPFAVARSTCGPAPAMYEPTRSFAAVATPCVLANFVTMKPLTPRNGTDRHLIFGTWTILKFVMPDFRTKS